jgi:hypothetical protein
MQRILQLLGRSLFVLFVALAALYGGEDVLLRFRLSHNGNDAVFTQVPVYEAAEVKGGKVEFYFDHPELQTCVHAAFPHFGDPPCWYVMRHTMKQVRDVEPQARPLELATLGIRERQSQVRVPGSLEKHAG